MCTQVLGANPKSIGFSDPDQLDEERIKFFTEQLPARPPIKVNLSIYTKYDLRFMAKLAIGLSHCLHENSEISEGYASELHKALWYKANDELPSIEGSTSFSTEIDLKFSDIVGIKGAIVLLITKIPNGTVANLNLGPRLNWSIKISEHLIEPAHSLDQAIVIFSEIGKIFKMSFQDYIAIKAKSLYHAELDEISRQIKSTEEYFKSLK